MAANYFAHLLSDYCENGIRHYVVSRDRQGIRLARVILRCHGFRNGVILTSGRFTYPCSFEVSNDRGTTIRVFIGN